MDMTDDQLLEKFFQTARQMEVADNGFSDRVMQHIPNERTLKLSRMWTAFCILVAVVIFVVFHGWDIIVYGLVMMVNTPPSSQQLLTYVASIGVIGLLALYEVIGRERYSAL